MTTTLAHQNHNQIKYIVGSNYDSIYARLKKILSEDELSFFAETSATSFERKWWTNLIGHISTLQNLAGDKLEIAKKELYNQHTTILLKLRQDKNWAK